jgi:hypothetical protein
MSKRLSKKLATAACNFYHFGEKSDLPQWVRPCVFIL